MKIKTLKHTESTAQKIKKYINIIYCTIILLLFLWIILSFLEVNAHHINDLDGIQAVNFFEVITGA